MLAARKEVIRRVQAQFPYLSPAEINGRLVAYCSDQAHSSVEKACLIGLVKLNLVPSDDKLRLRGNALRQAIAKDKENGLIPFYVRQRHKGDEESKAMDLVLRCRFAQLWARRARVHSTTWLSSARFVSAIDEDA